MKNKCLYYILPLIITCLCACVNGKTEKQVLSNDSIELATISLVDTLNDTINQVHCKINANVGISYPTKYMDKEKTEKLQKLFTEKVLDVADDSISLASAFPMYVKELVERYAIETAENYEVELGGILELECLLETTIKAVYNQNGIVCFEVRDSFTKNDQYYISKNNYYTFNLAEMRLVDVSDIFAEEDMAYISYQLKKQLKIVAGVHTEDELVELGFYNIDNVRVNNNFRIGNNGITWNYLPGELSVVEQIEITLDYDILRDYMLENSIVSKLID